MTQPSQQHSEAIAIAQMQMQLAHVMLGVDEIRAALKSELVDLKRRVDELEIDRIKREASDAQNARWGKVAITGVALAASGASWLIQLAAKHFGFA
jgi:hypothetical protein